MSFVSGKSADVARSGVYVLLIGECDTSALSALQVAGFSEGYFQSRQDLNHRYLPSSHLTF